MDYEKRLTTLKELLLTLSKKIQQGTASDNNAKFNESMVYMQQIESEINRIDKMRSYKNKL